LSEVRIVSLPGDGIGPEVTHAMQQVLEAVAAKFGHELVVEEHPVGYTAYEATGTPLPDETLQAAVAGPAVFLGAVGDPRADGLKGDKRPEAALLKLRSELECFANLRPAKVDAPLVAMSALKEEIASGCDLVIVRELTGGLYYGTPRGNENGRAVNTLVYDASEVERVARVAFELAQRRRKHLTSVDKANVLEVSQLWRSVVSGLASEYPDVTLEHMLVDRAAMELVTCPGRFDVLLTENMFGDILSDEASAMCGSLGLLSSASVGGAVGLYEPVHGSAPDIAGRGIANPIGAIRSGALMLSYSFGLEKEAEAVENAVAKVLADGLRTADLAADKKKAVSTKDFATAVAEAIA
jgi:3-isopropylmalate dehydrogenase